MTLAASPKPPLLQGATDLATFEERNSPEGRFLRYCTSRADNYWMRQVMTVLGALVLAVFDRPLLGLLAASLGFLGDTQERLVLRAVLTRGIAGPGARRAVLASTAVQTAALAACVGICWVLVPTIEAAFFAAVFLASGIMNAGLSRHQFRRAADLRIAGLSLAGAGYLVLSMVAPLQGDGRGFLAATVLTLGWLCAAFLNDTRRLQAHRHRFERALLQRSDELRQSQEQLEARSREAQRLALVARHSTDSVVFTTPDGAIEWVNDGFTRLTGYTLRESVGKLPGDLLNAPDTDVETTLLLAAAVRSRKPARVEILNQTKDGRQIWVDVALTPIFDESSALTTCIAVERDITEAKSREQELTRARAEAEEAGRAKAQFLATMSHEIRTPMNGVIGMADLLRETALDSRQREYVEQIVRSGESLLNIINDVLDLSRLQSGGMRLLEKPFEPLRVVEDAVSLLSPLALHKGVALAVDIPQGLPPTVLGDGGRLRQILLNLIGNAVKFTDRGAVSVSIAAKSKGAGWWLTFAVRDSGIGIDGPDLETLFDAFSQAETGIAQGRGGTGLGLAISRLLARAMGGDITVTSKVGKGSVFTLDLGFGAATWRNDVPQTLAQVVWSGQRVLVAEDNRTNALILRRMLEREALELEFVENGAEAVAAYRFRPPDLILMDMSMPVMDGLTAARTIREIESAKPARRCPIIALTANAFAEQREACMVAGLDDFLTKPLRRADLIEALALHLAPSVPARKALS